MESKVLNDTGKRIADIAFDSIISDLENKNINVANIDIIKFAAQNLVVNTAQRDTHPGELPPLTR